MTIKEHVYRKSADNRYHAWRVTIEHDGCEYTALIEGWSTSARVFPDDFYYTGRLMNPHLAKKYRNGCIQFGFSTYTNTYRYILYAMKKVIEGNYESVKGAGFCTDEPKEQEQRNS